MEAYSSYSSSSSSTCLLPKAKAKSGNSSSHSDSSVLHAVRKSPTKPWKKPAVAPPLPPKPPKVYKVDPVNFRDVVQKLTGATEFQPPRLQTAAPPPLSVAALLPLPPSVEPPRDHHQQLQHIPTAKRVPFWAVHPQDHMMSSGTEEIMKPQQMSDSSSEDAPFSQNWFSFPLLSPGSISSLDQSTYGSLAL
jgi:hypothetical protein